MNQYEREHVTRIINEIKEIEKGKEMSEVEKAYYLYRKLGDIYEYKVNYRYADELTYEQYMAKIKLYQEGNYYFANLTSDIMHIKTGMKTKILDYRKNNYEINYIVKNQKNIDYIIYLECMKKMKEKRAEKLKIY